jgi:hypothetical protein
MSTSHGGERPMLRLIRGDASAEEVAAIVTLLAARGSASTSGSEGRGGATSVWSVYGYGHRQIRATFARSPHGWRTSYWPR